VTFTGETLRQTLVKFTDVAGRPNRYLIAFSGGLDSTVLAHALAIGSGQNDPSIVIAHVDHGLQPASASWREHCEAFATQLKVDFVGLRVAVDQRSGLGPEAAAREARYAALRKLIEPGDWLLSAHHQDDLAETVLLNLLRGSGPAGVAGIHAIRRFASGWLVRPLLDIAPSALQEYAHNAALEWITDPSNIDQQFDRNYLRHEVLPRFEARWPDAVTRIRRSAELAREAAELLSELAEIDRNRAGDSPNRLDIDCLSVLSVQRQRNLLRHVIRELGLPVPGAVHLERIIAELVPAREDAQPIVAWPGARARRYRNRLYLLPANGLDRPVPHRRAVQDDRIVLDDGLGTLVLTRGAASGLDEALLDAGLELRYREGGEEFKPAGQEHTRKLKKLLQEAGIVPWMRERLPLLYADGRLVAVADLWIAAEAMSEPGVAIRWDNRPALN